MKKIVLTVMMISVLALTACGKAEETKQTETATETNSNEDEKEELVEEATTAETNTEAVQSDDSYVGQYLDYDYNEPELKISANEDGTYYVYVGLIRLTTFEDNAAIMTETGLEFTSVDDSGNPIKGVITLEGNDAIVTFTESTWSLIPSGTVYRYYRPATQY